MHCCVLSTIIVGIVAAVAKRHRELLLCYRGMRIAHSQSPAQHKELFYHHLTPQREQEFVPSEGYLAQQKGLLLFAREWPLHTLRELLHHHHHVGLQL